MGIAFHQMAILEGSRLHFVSVGNHVLGPGSIGTHRSKAPFEPGGEAGAATAAQARVLNFLLYFLRRHLVQGLAEALISTRMLIALEAESLAIRRYCLGKWSFRRHRYLHSSRIPSIFAASRLP